MLSPQVRVPCSLLKRYRDYIVEHRLNVELYLSGDCLDASSPSKYREILASLDHNPVITIHGPFFDLMPSAEDNLIREATRKRFMQTLEAAEVLKPKAIVLHSGYEKWKFSHKVDKWLDLGAGIWSEVARGAGSLGTRIAVENIFDETPEALSALMAALDTPHAGICFDAGHFNIFSSATLDDWLNALGRHVIEFHLHDNNGDRDFHNPVGAGIFDFAALFRHFRGRDVIHTIENNDEGSTMKSIRRIREIYQSLEA